jgi:hypothetical protein
LFALEAAADGDPAGRKSPWFDEGLGIIVPASHVKFAVFNS